MHFTGIVWAGCHGGPVAEAPAASQVPALSGACLAIPRDAWHEAGGFSAPFFLYHKDVDLSLRLRSRGCAVGIEPAAIVDHNHEFSAYESKWRCLERNRWAVLIRNYPTSLLLLLAPALIATELALIPVSIAEGWWRHKLAATVDVIRWLPRLLRERRQVQAARTVSAAQFTAWLTPDLDSPFIAPAARLAPVCFALRTYWRAVRRLLGARDLPGFPSGPYLLSSDADREPEPTAPPAPPASSAGRR